MLSGEILSDIPYVEFKKKRYKGNLLTKQKEIHRLRE